MKIPGGASGKEPACQCRKYKRCKFDPWVGRSPRGGIKRLPAMQKTQARSLSWEDPLEKEMATHCSILIWRIPWTEEPGGLQSTGS